MVLQRCSDKNVKGPRNKNKRLVDNSNWRPWSELPEDLVHLITKQLGAIDYLMFGCVCRGWRLYVERTGKSLWHPNPHQLCSYQCMLRELVTSIAFLIKGRIRQHCQTLLANHVSD